jgi:superfamily II RNA helicase
MGGGTSTGGGPNNQKGGQKKFEAFFKNLKAIKSEGLLPCVVFFFSRAQVESLANEVDGNINFIGDVERKAIKDFKKKALQRLEENDRDLP